MTSQRLNRSNRGRRLEAAVIASQRDVIRVRKTAAGAKWLAGGKVIRQVGPPDFIGCVVGTGRAICFEAKEEGDRNRFPVARVRPHQALYLAEQGGAGAVAGVLIEATAHGRYYWLSSGDLTSARLHREASIPWTDGRLIDLGDARLTISFSYMLTRVGVSR